MNIRPTTLRAFCGAALLMGAAASHAAPDANAEARYQKDRAACLSGQTQQARDVCLREAGAARDAAGKGALKSSGSNEKAANAVERCEVFSKADEHAACLDRIRGSGQTSGSALQGGVLRESVTTTTTVIPAKP
ncbi:MAG: hypothetical protein KBF40_11545 [Giesbergeria sp.]|jgi:hypothetical protein|nr:hypothetical protein [Simplicispira sp.]MBP6118752.1 hypothetical protein [Giesbergeria sp.]MBP6159916.1 hypothetical protein [Giesbergeria sp.]MBP7084146.1 hypothetical protein [Giesbergeria sp.]MBP9785911.1 hypothetical protein [Giesbergeria sp.]